MLNLNIVLLNVKKTKYNIIFRTKQKHVQNAYLKIDDVFVERLLNVISLY